VCSSDLPSAKRAEPIMNKAATHQFKRPGSQTQKRNRLSAMLEAAALFFCDRCGDGVLVEVSQGSYAIIQQ